MLGEVRRSTQNTRTSRTARRLHTALAQGHKTGQEPPTHRLLCMAVWNHCTAWKMHWVLGLGAVSPRHPSRQRNWEASGTEPLLSQHLSNGNPNRAHPRAQAARSLAQDSAWPAIPLPHPRSALPLSPGTTASTEEGSHTPGVRPLGDICLQLDAESSGATKQVAPPLCDEARD